MSPRPRREALLVALVALPPCIGAGFIGAFEHGVASGDPFSHSIVLWTRITPQLQLAEQPPINLSISYRVWREDAIDGASERAGVVRTDGEMDWTVKTVVDGLQHSVPYLFAFSLGAAQSPIGRFRLPPPAGEPLAALRYAIFSCSSWSWGYFNAYRAAEISELDFWLHLGDYFYEYGKDGHYPSAEQAVRWAGLSPPGETITLSDYRLRHALHRSDADLQALSAAAPLIAVWDDHEIANDPWVGGAQDHNPELGEGDWWARKRAAVKAYHEWMPTRQPPPAACEGGSSSADACSGSHAGESSVYRSFRFGDLAALHMLETRLLARSEQGVEGGTDAVASIVGEIPPHAWRGNASIVQALTDLNASWAAVRNAAGRQMLGGTQLAWLADAVANASSGGATWQLLGQQVVVQPRRPPDLALAAATAPTAAERAEWQATLTNLTAAPSAGRTVRWHDGMAHAARLLGKPQPVTPQMASHTRALLAQAAFGLNSDFDSWDGYPAARQRLLQALAAAAGGRAAVYAGDSHVAWAGSLRTDEGRHVALEFDGTSVTSSGPDTWTPYLPPRMLAAAYVAATPGLEYVDTHHRGWLDVKLTPSSHVVAYRTVSTVGSPHFTTACGAAFSQSAEAPQTLTRVPCAPLERGRRASPPTQSTLLGACFGAALAAAATALLYPRVCGRQRRPGEAGACSGDHDKPRPAAVELRGPAVDAAANVVEDAPSQAHPQRA